MSIIWTIIIGFVAGVVAKLLHPGPNEPSGFILTTLLGIADAFVATFSRPGDRMVPRGPERWVYRRDRRGDHRARGLGGVRAAKRLSVP